MLQRSISNSASCSDEASTGSNSLDLLPVAVCGSCGYLRCMALALKTAGFSITYVWDNSPSAAEALAKELEVEKWTTREEDFLRDPSVCMVVMWTAPSVQALLFDKAVGMGKSVICGFPVAVDHTAVRRMWHAVNEHSLLYMVGQSLRFLPSVVKAKALMKEGHIGRFCLSTVRLTCPPLTGDSFNWCCDSVMGGGVLARFGALIIDLLHHITGVKMAKVSGMTKTFNRQTEKIRGIRQITADDFCCFQFETEIPPSCGVVTLNASGTSQESFAFEMIIQGSNGHLRLCNTDLHHLSSGLREEQLVVSDPLTKSDRDRVGGLKTPNPVAPILSKGFIHMADALKAATTEGTPEPLQMGASFDDWKYVQRVVDAIVRAAESREWCSVRAKAH